MKSRTPQELSKAVMDQLGVIDALEFPSAIDHQYIFDRYTDLMDELRADELGYWPDDQIPGLVFLAVADLVALHVGPAFGRPVVAVTDIEDAQVPIKRRIRRYTKKHASGEVSYQDHF
jgi:hypothetical protein